MREASCRVFVVALGLAWTGSVGADPAPQPLPKTGSCPSGYSTSGGYCAPSTNARFAVPKIGSCPSGYSTSGDYCLAGKGARLAVPKSGPCPSGYSTSGDYCLRTGK